MKKKRKKASTYAKQTAEELYRKSDPGENLKIKYYVGLPRSETDTVSLYLSNSSVTTDT